jgi:hypothetical protein
MMPVAIEWGNYEHTILIGTLDWPWSWDELSAGWHSAVEMMRSVEHPVHMIVVGKTTRFPIGNILSNLTAITKNVPSNIGLAVMVTENRFQETINTIFFKLSPSLRHKGFVVNSLEKALELVAQETCKQDRVS